MKELQGKLDNYIEVAQYLSDEINEHTLIKLKERFQSQRLFLPIIGQFDAGKSKLINNLLKRDILPVKGVETTAYVTYIEYTKDATDEGAFIEDLVGNLKRISLEELKGIDQISINKSKGKKDINAIHVKINSDFLKNGLVLIDTPGVNTLITDHEDLTFSILPEAQYLVYVFGKAISKTDLEIINKISKFGIRIIFVRTKLDIINESEETIENAIQHDVGNIEKIFEISTVYYPITNESSLLQDEYWNDKVNELYKFLYKNVSENISESIETSLQKRLEAIKLILEQKLIDKQNIMQKISNQDENELNEKLDVINKQIGLLEKDSSIVAKEIKNNFEEVNNSIKWDIIRSSNNNVHHFKELLEEIDDIDKLQSIVSEKAQSSIEKLIKESESCLDYRMKELIDNSLETYNKKLIEVKNELLENIDISVNMELEPIDINRLNESKNFYNEKLVDEVNIIRDFLSKSEEELQEYQINKEDMTELSNEINAYIKNSKQELERLGVYIPKDIFIAGDTNVSEALGRIGSLADWALLLIPSTALSKGGAKIATTVNKVLKGGKKAEQIANVAQKVKKAADTMSRFDKIKDSVYVVKQIQDKAKKSGIDEKIGILDLLTLEYWFKKSGSIFDTPPRVDIDKAYEIEYYNERSMLNQKYNEYIINELKQLEEMDLLKSREDKKKKEIELKDKYLKKITKELEEDKEINLKKAKVKAKNEYIETCTKLYKNKAEDIQANIIKGIGQVLEDVKNDIIISSTTESKDKLTKLKKTIEELLIQKQTNKNKEEEEFIKDYINLLND